jgi:hypothetical protein
LSTYLQISSVYVRIVFMLLIFAGGTGMFLYFALWLLLPANTEQEQMPWDQRLSHNAEELGERMRTFGLEMARGFRDSPPQLPMYLGGTLVIMGGLFLIQTLNLSWLSWLRLDLFWALALISAGVLLIYRRAK